MIKKADWEAAYRSLLAEGRQRLGDPPTEEDLVAFSEGRLSEEEAARVREFLVYYPELVRTLHEPFPFPYEGKPGDPDFLSDEDLTQDWKALQARVLDAAAAASALPEVSQRDVSPAPPRAVEPAGKPLPGRGFRFTLGPLVRVLTDRRMAAAVGFAFAIVFGGLYWRSVGVIDRLEQEARDPRINPEHRLLYPDGVRGAEQPPIRLSAEADHFLLTPALISSDQVFSDYRLDIIDLSKPQPERIWSRAGLRRRADNTFEIWIPRAFLKPGTYRLELYGLNAGRESPLETYTIELPSGGA